MDMTDSEFLEFADRETAKSEWFTRAASFVRTLRAREKDLAQAIAARDAALEARDKAIKDIEVRKQRDVTAAAVERTRLVDLLAKDQDKARQAVTAAEAELARVLDLIKQARSQLELAEAQRDAFRSEAHLEAADLTARNTKLHRELEANRERLTAALKV